MKSNVTGARIEMRILVADDHPGVRSALKLLLEQEFGLYAITGVGNSEELWMAMKEYCPDMLLLDWELPGNNGGELVQTIREKCTKPIIIILSSHPEAQKAAIDAGADGFIGKGSSAQEVVAAVTKYLQIEGNH